jgi:hypothetical protein
MGWCWGGSECLVGLVWVLGLRVGVSLRLLVVVSSWLFLDEDGFAK